MDIDQNAKEQMKDTKSDKELDAIADVLAIVGQLTSAQAQRVIRYVSDRTSASSDFPRYGANALGLGAIGVTGVTGPRG